MFRKLRTHLLIALLFFTMTLMQQYLFYAYEDMAIVWLSFGKYFGVLCFLIASTFIRSKKTRFFFLSFVMILNLFQMAHLSYFGTQILPNEFFLLITQFDEIKGTLVVEFTHVLIALLFTIIPLGIGWFVIKRYRNLYYTKVMGPLFLLYLVYNPARTMVTGNTWGRQPSTRELAGMNVYLSFSYFMGKILPYKIMRGDIGSTHNSSTDLFLEQGQDEDWDQIIVVLGESLTPSHMSLFGYEKPTTPFLYSMIDHPDFYSTIGLSGGVSTDIAVAFLLNMGFGKACSKKASEGKHCLFRLAKEKDFTTHFISIQSQDQLRYIAPYVCAGDLDDYLSLEDISPETQNHLAAKDRDLLDHFKKMNEFKVKQFIMLHQRGSHAPWELRSDPKNRLFPHNSKVNYYDNSVVEFDLFMQELYGILSESKKKTLVMYVSDHGESLGQNGFWGHGQLNQQAFEVPVIFMAFNKPLPPKVRLLPKFVPHYNLSLLLANELGFKTSQDPQVLPKDYMIYGSDIDGFAGKAEILFKPQDTYDFKVIQ